MTENTSLLLAHITPIPVSELSGWERYLVEATDYIKLNSARFLMDKPFLEEFVDAYAVIAFHISDAARDKRQVTMPDMSGLIEAQLRHRGPEVLGRMTLREALMAIQKKFAEARSTVSTPAAEAQEEVDIDQLPTAIREQLIAIAEELGIELEFDEALRDLLHNFEAQEMSVQELASDKRMKKLLDEVRQTFQHGLRDGTYTPQPSAGQGRGGNKGSGRF